jgi:hypothetical protein
MIGQYERIVFTSLFLMGSAFGEERTQYLRLLDLDGSAKRDEFNNPTKEDIQCVDNSSLNAYEYLATCYTLFGAERYVRTSEAPTMINVTCLGWRLMLALLTSTCVQQRINIFYCFFDNAMHTVNNLAICNEQ